MDRCNGGPIKGPGPHDDDTLLMPGPHGCILTAGEVATLGGHAEIERLRAILRGEDGDPEVSGG